MIKKQCKIINYVLYGKVSSGKTTMANSLLSILVNINFGILPKSHSENTR